MFNLITQIVKSNYPQADIRLIEKAYSTASRYLRGQKRGNLNYIDHPVGTALTLARMKMDQVVVVAALLHDLPRHSEYGVEDIGRDFGPDVGKIMVNLNAISHIDSRFRGTDRYLESARRMFIAVAKDYRVILIKLAERLNNLEHLDSFPVEKQKRYIEMSEKLYIPLASLLGLWRLRADMEDICFKYRHPQEYQKIKDKLDKGLRSLGDQIVEQVRQKISKLAKKQGLAFEISTRFKHIRGIHKKMQEKNKGFNEIYDAFAVRIIVSTVWDCYSMLGIIHSLWRPKPRRVKDYIAAPKPNGYRSLHTTVFSDEGYPMEFQVRTQEMQDEARYGLAAQYFYKHPHLNEDISHWIGEILNTRKQHEENDVKDFTFDLLSNRIFVYTPKGDVIELAEGATPLDFAYMIHTDVGNHCVSVLVNDIKRPFDYQLRNNDVVEIITRSTKKPAKSWLRSVRTRYARQQILKALEIEAKTS
ncbi:MAG: HD domain-containing protein [Patescibacteria group bacterium]